MSSEKTDSLMQGNLAICFFGCFSGLAAGPEHFINLNKPVSNNRNNGGMMNEGFDYWKRRQRTRNCI